MLLCCFNNNGERIYIYRLRYNLIIRLLSNVSWLYAPNYILRSSKLTKYKYTSSLIFRAFIKITHASIGQRWVCSFSHSANETICAFSPKKLAISIGVDIEHITKKPRKSIIDHIKNNIGTTNLDAHLRAIIIISCMESAFKAWSFLIKSDFSLDIFNVLLINDSICRMKIKINENKYLDVDVNYLIKGKYVISACFAKK